MGDDVIEGYEGYLSDESSFYGDDDVKADFEARVEAVQITLPSITEIADLNIAKAMDFKKICAELYNPYEGWLPGRQLSETVDQFLKRLPPATSRQTVSLPWIFIANPFIPRGHRDKSTPNSKPTNVGIDENPDAEDNTSWAQCVILGQNILGELKDDIAAMSRELAKEPKMKLTKAKNRRRDEAVTKLQECAVELGCTSGKWMLFVTPEDVNEVWAVVARATASGDLGTAAKVAPDSADNGRSFRVVCIYTKDFTDLEDVKRVVVRLKELGCIMAKGRPIYYKADLYTYLQIKSGNEWNLKASLYASSEFMGASLPKIEGMLKRKASAVDFE